MAEVNFKEENIICSMYHGVWQSRCLSLLVSLGVPEILCNSVSTSMSIDEIAEKTGCTASGQLYRVLSALAQWGIGVEKEDKHFAANRAIELLRRDQGQSMGHLVCYYGSDEIWAAMMEFPEAVKSGQPAYEIAHGMDLYEYMAGGKPTKTETTHKGGREHEMGSKERKEEFGRNYDLAMAQLSKLELQNSRSSIFDVYPWNKWNRIMDVGGGNGHFLVGILNTPGCQNVQGILFDFPNVITRARELPVFQGELKNRVEFVEGDALKGFPESLEVDLIVAKNFFVMLTEQKMLQVLENGRKVLTGKQGRFLIVNSSLGTSLKTATGLQPAFRGIHTITLCKAARFPTKSEWLQVIERLCAKVAFKLGGVYDTNGGGPTIFELCTV